MDNEKEHVKENDDLTIKPEEKERSLTYEIITFIRDIGIILLIFWFVTTFIGEKTSVIGDSMEPNIHDGNVIIMTKINYRFTDPERYDVIVFPYNNGDDNYIKRIIGLPGETIDIDETTGEIYIDGQILDEDYGIEPITRMGNQTFPLTIPEGEYFVMGDNRNDSSDSRFQDVGTIKKEDILGKAWLRVWPFSQFGAIH